MKKTYDIRNICKCVSKEINISDGYDEYLKQWKNKFIETVGKEPTDLDIFYAGYIMANPIVRDMYKKYGEKKRNEEIELHRYDNIS